MMLIKVGGGTETNENGIVKDIARLKRHVVFVHGGRKQTDLIAEQLGHPTRRIMSPSGLTSIYTDKKAIQIMTMMYAGYINKRWVELFQKHGINAVGLSGADGRIWVGERKPHIVAQVGKRQKLLSDTWTGRVTSVNAAFLKLLVDHGFLPVLTQPAISRESDLINTDNDRNLAVMAKALRVKELVVLFEAPGLLRDPRNESSLIRRVSRSELPGMMQYAQGTMKKKILGAVEAFAARAKTIYWGDSRTAHPVKDALAGKGTVIQ